jgi:hypothetical protein
VVQVVRMGAAQLQQVPHVFLAALVALTGVPAA